MSTIWTAGNLVADGGFENATWGEGSLTPVADELLAEAPSVNKHLGIDLAAGAELALDFPGTLKIDRLKVAGRQYKGLLGAYDLPGTLSGQGKLLVEDKSGLRIILQ